MTLDDFIAQLQKMKEQRATPGKPCIVGFMDADGIGGIDRMRIVDVKCAGGLLGTVCLIPTVDAEDMLDQADHGDSKALAAIDRAVVRFYVGSTGTSPVHNSGAGEAKRASKYGVQ